MPLGTPTLRVGYTLSFFVFIVYLFARVPITIRKTSRWSHPSIPAMHQQIIASLEMSRSFLLAAVADIPDERFAVQPPGVPNHAAWTLGHLIYSCQLIGGEMGLQPWLGKEWNWPNRFGGGSVPVATRDAYPAKPELVNAINDSLSRLTARLAELGDAGLDTDLPDARYRRVFPTLGHAVLQVAVAHFGYHLGQLVVWRRAVGMGEINQRFL